MRSVANAAVLARVERFEVKESRANSRLHHDCERSSLAIVVRRALTTGSTLGQPSNDTIRSAAASMIHSQHCSPKAWQHFHGDPRPICSRGRRENPPKSMPRTTARHALDPGAALGAYKACNVGCNKQSSCNKLRGLVTSYLVTLTSHITSTGLQAPDYKGGLQPLVTPLLAVS